MDDSAASERRVSRFPHQNVQTAPRRRAAGDDVGDGERPPLALIRVQPQRALAAVKGGGHKTGDSLDVKPRTDRRASSGAELQADCKWTPEFFDRIKPVCRFCSAAFETPTEWREHERVEHADGPRFCCRAAACERRFRNVVARNRHEQRFHTPAELLAASTSTDPSASTAASTATSASTSAAPLVNGSNQPKKRRTVKRKKARKPVVKLPWEVLPPAAHRTPSTAPPKVQRSRPKRELKREPVQHVNVKVEPELEEEEAALVPARTAPAPAAPRGQPIAPRLRQPLVPAAPQPLIHAAIRAKDAAQLEDQRRVVAVGGEAARDEPVKREAVQRKEELEAPLPLPKTLSTLSLLRALSDLPPVLYCDYDATRDRLGKLPLRLFARSRTCSLLLLRTSAVDWPHDGDEFGWRVHAAGMPRGRRDVRQPADRAAHLLAFARRPAEPLVRRFVANMNAHVRFAELLDEILPLVLDARPRSALILAADADKRTLRQATLESPLFQFA